MSINFIKLICVCTNEVDIVIIIHVMQIRGGS
jgi:hypothetical protein